MSGEFLGALGAASLSGGVMVLTALSLRLAFQDRAPRRVFCLLWDLSLARLLILGEIPSPVSIQGWLRARSWERASAAGGNLVFMPAGTPIQRVYVVEGTGTAALQPVPPVPSREELLFLVWLAAAVGLAGWFLWDHLRSRRTYADSLPCRDPFVLSWLEGRTLRRPLQVRTSDRITAPLTYGVARPVILLPAGMDRTALSCVLEHEYEHIRRFDTLRKALLAAALCLHWFNPLVWALYVLANRDMELRCDEAAVGAGAGREEYALALLALEEQRSRWGLSGSHFSQNALEERIRAIMKHKKFSIAALAAVLALMGGATCVFASAAPESRPGEDRNTPGSDSQVEDTVVISKEGETGGERYSDDGGRTWINQEQYNAKYRSLDWQVEWWTVEDYTAWLEQEKQDLQGMIGEQGYTGSRGWFTWDQQMVDETIAMYEGILEEIKNGALYSKRIVDKDGSEVEDTVLGSGGAIAASVIMDYPSDVSDELADLLEQAQAFGVTKQGDQLYYKGQIVHTLVDGRRVERGYTYGCAYKNDNGTIDLQVQREVTMGENSQWDTSGRVTGILSERDAGFDRNMTALLGVDHYVWSIHGSEAPDNADAVEAAFARYEKYGLVYLPRECGIGSMTYSGQPVKSFTDQKPDGGVFRYEDPNAADGLAVYTRYDPDGELAGLRAE